jgi:phosphate transport system substrate-binding protein
VKTQILAFLCLISLLPGCTQTPTPTVEIVNVTLLADTSTLPLIEELIAVYGSDRPHVTMRLESGLDTDRALEALQAGQGDLAVLSWLPDEVKTANRLWYRAFARDAIVVITHHDNPVAGLTLEQIRRLYQGQVLSWSELGGPQIEVVPVSREQGSGARFSFEALVMGDHSVTPTAVVMPHNEGVVEYVATNPGAVGYVSTLALQSTVNVLAVEGITPSLASVEEGQYALSRPFYLVAPSQPGGGLAAFVNWVVAGEGQGIVKRTHASAP